ncbi:hypothetical protein DKX38_015745 [Salix brachista]|uniref:Uncharacterized protein n=1 Tax=Salix brachista TaxID=2182728 RepID=A0A5N5L693_9ROSI|nr:hypothetical protein DKX38_015745 [Salix brachista]
MQTVSLLFFPFTNNLSPHLLSVKKYVNTTPAVSISTQRHGNFTCNCSWKPYSSCGPFKCKCGKTFRVPGLRIKGLQNDEYDNRLVGNYGKAMESAKTGREKNQVHKSISYKLKDDLEGNDAPLLERDQRTVKSRDFKDRVKVSKFMESDEFGSNANGLSGEEDVVNA